MANRPAYSSVCIFAIRHTKLLREAYQGGGSGCFTERFPWVAGVQLLREAQKKGLQMPIFFAASDIESGLLYFARLTQVKIDDTNPGARTTTYCFDGLTRLDSPRPLSSLILRSKRRPLSDNHQRSYAICFTPAFLGGQDEADVFAVKGDAG